MSSTTDSNLPTQPRDFVPPRPASAAAVSRSSCNTIKNTSTAPAALAAHARTHATITNSTMMNDTKTKVVIPKSHYSKNYHSNNNPTIPGKIENPETMKKSQQQNTTTMTTTAVNQATTMTTTAVNQATTSNAKHPSCKSSSSSPSPSSSSSPPPPPAATTCDIYDAMLGEIHDLLQAAQQAQALGRLKMAATYLLLVHARLVGLGKRFDGFLVVQEQQQWLQTQQSQLQLQTQTQAEIMPTQMQDRPPSRDGTVVTAAAANATTTSSSAVVVAAAGNAETPIATGSLPTATAMATATPSVMTARATGAATAIATVAPTVSGTMGGGNGGRSKLLPRVLNLSDPSFAPSTAQPLPTKGNSSSTLQPPSLTPVPPSRSVIQEAQKTLAKILPTEVDLDNTMMEHLARAAMELHNRRTGRGMLQERTKSSPFSSSVSTTTTTTLAQSETPRRADGSGARPTSSMVSVSSGYYSQPGGVAWTDQEKKKCLQAAEMYGSGNVEAIAAHVGSRTAGEVRAHLKNVSERGKVERQITGTAEEEDDDGDEHDEDSAAVASASGTGTGTGDNLSSHGSGRVGGRGSGRILHSGKKRKRVGREEDEEDEEEEEDEHMSSSPAASGGSGKKVRGKKPPSKAMLTLPYAVFDAKKMVSGKL